MKKFIVVILVLIISMTAMARLFVRPAVFSANKAGATSNYYSSAAGMILIEAETGTVLAEKNADAKMKMASTTKVLTAITAIENAADLDKIVKVSQKAAGIEGSSIYLKAGEEISLRNLLFGLMLRSGNDSAAAIAFEVGGSIESFAEMMNETAKKAGATNSNFMNPHGLDHENHYTTARDLGLITAYAMKNANFKEIVSAKSHKIPANNLSAERFLVNKNKILRTFNGGIGVKTGFTKKAGRCLVSAAERDGMTVIAVVLNCGPMFEDCSRLMESAFLDYMFYKPEFQKEFVIPVINGLKESVEAQLEPNYEFKKFIRKSSIENFKVEVLVEEFIKAPLKMGDSVGSVKIMNNNEVLKEIKIILKEDVKEALKEEKPLIDIIKELID